MRPPDRSTGVLRHVEAWSTARRAGALTAYAVGVVAVAFLWPAALGGCTALAVVPSGAAGDGLVAGDVVVTRCAVPDVGDRVVHRGSGAAWSVGHVVGTRDDGWQVRGGDGEGRAVPAQPDVLDVLPVHVPRTTAEVTAAAGVVLAAAIGARTVVRRRAATRPA